MRRLDALLLSGVGVLLVHQLAYGSSTLLGHETAVEHGHLAAAWLLSSLGVLVALARSITQSLRGRNHRVVGLGTLSATIAAGYGVLEFAERSLEGLGGASVLTEPVFWLGLMATPIVALLLSWSARSVERLIASAFADARGSTWPSTAPSSLVATSVDVATHFALSFTVSRRGPPRRLPA